MTTLESLVEPPGGARAFLDAENLFHGFRPAAQGEVADTVQRMLFGTPSPEQAEDNAVARMLRLVHAVVGWFERAAGRRIAHIESAGKAVDAVQTFLFAISDPDDPGSRYDGTGNAPEKVHRLWIENRIRVEHTMVRTGPDVADRHLIDRFEQHLSQAPRNTAYLVGSADDLVLSRFDAARAERRGAGASGPRIDVWAVLPVHPDPAHRWDVLDKFRTLGPYPHIPRDHVRMLGQLAAPNGPGGRFSSRRRSRERAQAKGLEAADASAGTVGEGGRAVSMSAVAAPVALLLGLLPERLDRVPRGTPAWRSALGDVRTASAVQRTAERVVRPDELAALDAGEVGGERALRIVRLCVVLQAFDDHEVLTAARLRAYLGAVRGRNRGWSGVLEALEALQVRGLVTR